MIKQVIKGMATYVPGAYQMLSRKRTGGTDSARYCYSVWLRHMVMMRKHGSSAAPRSVAELGPGDSLGIGLAALLTGSAEYYACDLHQYANPERDTEILRELVSLFRAREPIPGEEEFPRVIPRLDSYEFPSDLLLERGTQTTWADPRIERIRWSIENRNDEKSVLRYAAPWHDSDVIRTGSVDLVFSQAVLEHVDDLRFTYRTMYSWLKPHGLMSHSIDFRCHGTADEWNGHWTYSDLTWKAVKGRRLYSLNREPHSTHLRLLQETGFEPLCDVRTQTPSRLGASDLARRFKNLSEQDLTTSGTYVQAFRRD